jgi:hypothetical protein
MDMISLNEEIISAVDEVFLGWILVPERPFVEESGL